MLTVSDFTSLRKYFSTIGWLFMLEWAVYQKHSKSTSRRKNESLESFAKSSQTSSHNSKFDSPSSKTVFNTFKVGSLEF